MASEVSQQGKLLGLVWLMASLAAAAILVAEHLGHLELPGCQEGSGCAALAAGFWGNIFGWPVSYLGTAYFAALAVFWLWAGWRAGISRWLVWGVRLGVLGSLFFVVVMLVEGHFCQYCSVVHGGNLAFWIVLECSRRKPGAPIIWPSLAGAVTFAAVTALLAGLDVQVKQEAAEKSEKAFEESLGRIVEHVRTMREPPADDDATPFTGRFRLGPEKAAIRLVVFSDYQCKDCVETHHQIKEVLEGRNDVSVSHKQFPLCPDCNRQVKGKFHDNACRAALAAEAAGIIAGNDAFWKMSHWLYERKAEFTEEELVAALPDLGVNDTGGFLTAMDGPEALSRVKADIDEGISLGLNWTPMIFINGVELRGNDAPQAVQRAVAAVAEAHPVPMTAAADRPIAADDKLFEEWLATEPLEFPEREARWTLGPADAKHRVVFIVCHQNPYTPAVSRAIRDMAQRRNDVRVEFWHFPISKTHNPKFAKMKKDRYPDTYQMALVAEATGRLSGNEAFWKMHDWLLEHQEDFNTDAALDFAASIGIDREGLAAEMAGQAVRSSLDEDMSKAIEAGLTWASDIFVDGKKLPSWGAPSRELLDRALGPQ